MVYQVISTEPATTNYPTRVQVLSEYATRAEAESRVKELGRTDYNVDIREKPVVPVTTNPQHYEEYGVPKDDNRRRPDYAEKRSKEIKQTYERYKETYGKKAAEKYIERVTGKKEKDIFVEQRTIGRLQSGTTETQYVDIGKEKQRRITETLGKQEQMKWITKQAEKTFREYPEAKSVTIEGYKFKPGKITYTYTPTPGGTISKGKVPIKYKPEILMTQYKKEGKVAEAIFVGTVETGVYAGIGFAKGITAPFRPSFYTKEIPGMVKLFTEYHPEVGQELLRRPGPIIGETFGYTKGMGTLIKNQPFKYEEFKVPTAEGETVLYRGLSIQVGKYGKPIVGYSPMEYSQVTKVTPQGEAIVPTSKVAELPFKVPKEGGVKVGTPKVSLTRAEGSFIVESPTQTEIFIKSIKDVASEVQVEKFERGLSIMRITERTPSKFVREKFTREIKALSPEGVGEVIKFARKQKGEVYGSFPAEAQMPADLSRTPGDIDVFLKVSQAEAEEQALFLTQKLKGVGVKARVSEQTKTLIETNVKGTWRHAVDIHSMEQGMEDVLSPSYASERIYGLRLGQKPITIEKVEAMPLSEQGLRKGASIYTARVSGGKLEFAPEAHRMKDIGDFFATQETLLRSKNLGYGKAKGFSELGKLKELYADELGTGGQAQVQLYKPSPSEINIPTVKTSAGIASFGLSSKSISYPSISRSISIRGSISPSRSPSISRSLSYSISRSVSPSSSISRMSSPSPSISPSIIGSPSITPSPSISQYPSVSPSVSPSPSPSPSPYPTGTPGTPPPPPPVKLNFPESRYLEFGKTKTTQKGKRKYIGTPSLSVVGLGKAAAGVKLTKAQLAGKELINPFQIRKVM